MTLFKHRRESTFPARISLPHQLACGISAILTYAAASSAIYLLGVFTSTAVPWEDFLSQRVLEREQTVTELVAFVEPRLPILRIDSTADAWERQAAEMRSSILNRVVFRGQAAQWRDAPCRVEWLESIAGGPGYRIRQLRYEALPGMWIPALLYEPEPFRERVPVVLSLNGHEPKGKATDYTQIRCINLAKRGMLALSVEWFGVGQLQQPGFNHTRMNQLDLCGASGLAPFYLVLQRGLDLLLALPNADAERVGVTGLSGGGWQTIMISALDPRVKLANPVAGFATFPSRLHLQAGLGDSEQTPVDLATIADYSHLTALMAPRPMLLTFNAKDIAYPAKHCLPPILEAGRPAYALFGQADILYQHINTVPGTHNFEKDNREALYRVLSAHFTRDGDNWPLTEIDSAAEVKTGEQLRVALPEDNVDFNKLALDLLRRLPASESPPPDAALRDDWVKMHRAHLRRQVGYRPMTAFATRVRETIGRGWHGRAWRLQLNAEWQVPVIELTPDGVLQTTIVFADDHRSTVVETVKRLLSEKHRVLVVEPFCFGECRIAHRGHLYTLLIHTIGERPLGIQSGQLVAVANWACNEWNQPIGLKAFGPRSSCISLVATAIDSAAIASLELQNAYSSLSQLLTENVTYDTAPELFCAGLLATYDLPFIRQLIEPGVSLVIE